MTALQALLAARMQGATVSVQDGRLWVEADEPLPEETLAGLREHRDALLGMFAVGESSHDTNEPSDEQRFPFAVRWARERGWLRVRDCFTGEWHEVLATQCPAWWRDEAFRAKTRRAESPDRG